LGGLPALGPKEGTESNTLKIVFGLNLDGYQDPRTRDRFNELICGPNGFLGTLELRLGLARYANRDGVFVLVCSGSLEANSMKKLIEIVSNLLIEAI
jgi:hypothetical protein